MRCSALVLLVVAGCTGASVNPVGRPCSDDEPCGPGAVCDRVTGTCQPEQSADLGPSDGPADLPDQASTDAGSDTKPDLPPPPDQFVVDTFQVPDGGCPPGYERCGDECAKLSESFNHCGACGSACDGAVSNACVAGKCVCGAGGECTAGLNCVSDACVCTFGGECAGCCDGNTCLALGGAQSVTKCGAGGIPCDNCHDGDYCTADTCDASGTCQSAPGNNGFPCDDGDDCTHTDVCSGGQCGGTSYSCDDGLTCTTASCTGQAPPAECNAATLLPGFCLIGGGCIADQVPHPTDPCYQCSAGDDTSDWSQAPGCVFTIAGAGSAGQANGAALSATFDGPNGVAVDSAGKVYVADRENHVIRLVYGGQVTTFAGTMNVSGDLDGAALSARFNGPSGIALDSTGTRLYVCDRNNNKVRVVEGGQVTTFAGSGSAGLTNGAALSAAFDVPYSVAVHGAKVYVVDYGNHRVRLIEGGQVSTLAGSGDPTTGSFANGGATTSARFNGPVGLAVDPSGGNLYVADLNNNCVRLVSGGQVTTFAGQCPSAGLVNGPAAQARFDKPSEVDLFGGKLYVADSGNDLVRLIDNGAVSTAAGSTSGYLDGPVLQARFNSPRRLAVDAAGLVYVSEAYNHRIRLVRF